MLGSTRSDPQSYRHYERGCTIGPKTLRQMKSTFPCVDLKFEGNTIIQQGESRKGVLRFVDDDHFNFAESKVQHVIHPELHWRLLDRTKHGRIHVNSQHVKVEFYIRHGDYVSEQQLADMLASEIETMGESLCEMDLEQEVAKCC